jgi:hypothetical protein
MIDSEYYTGPCFICNVSFSLKTLRADGEIVCKGCRSDTFMVGNVRLDPTCTPDILFLDPIMINNVVVHWIDFKAYYASFLISSDKRHKTAPLNRLPNQISRYTQAYGPGAIFFLRGFHKNLAKCWESKHNCLLLDATDMDISEFNAE